MKLNRMDEAVLHLKRASDLFIDDREKVVTLLSIGKLYGQMGR